MRWRDGESTMRIPRFAPSRTVLVVALLVAAALTTAAWLGLQPPSPAEPAFPLAEATPAPATAPAGPPWRYGRADARFTVVEYTDLECPFCRAYFAVLKRWIDAHPDVSWQWHHLPLPLHEPAASADARLVECVGEAGGQAAFWQAAEWVYTHTRGDGQGLPEGLRYPDLTPAVQDCLDSDRPDAVIRAQAASSGAAGHRGHAGPATARPRVRQDPPAARSRRRRCLAVGHRPARRRQHGRSRTRPFPRHARRRCR